MTKFLVILTIFISVSNSWSQSKKEQIELLNTRIDSLQDVISSERLNHEATNKKLEQTIEQERDKNTAHKEHIIELGKEISLYKREKQTNQQKIKELRDSIQSLKGTLELCGFNTEQNKISPTLTGSAILLTELKTTPEGFFLNGTPYTGAVYNAPYRDTTLYGTFNNGLKSGLWMESVHSRLTFTQFRNGKKNGPSFKIDLRLNNNFIQTYALFNQVTDIKSLVLLIRQYKLYVHDITLTTYSDNKKNGQYIYFHHNSEYYYFGVEMGNYKNDKKQGKWYTANSATMKNWNQYSTPSTPNTGYFVVSNYHEDKKEGVTEKYQSGILQERIRYKEDRYHGDYERYDSRANLISITTYNNGREIRD